MLVGDLKWWRFVPGLGSEVVRGDVEPEPLWGVGQGWGVRPV